MSTRPDFETATLEALRREVPESLEWLFATAWPDVRWKDGETADRRVVKGWMVLADRRQDASPDAEQREQAELLDEADLADLAEWILDAWIDHEAEPPPISDARHQEMKDMARQAAHLAQRLGRGGTDPEERLAQLLALEAAQEAPSSWPHRGLLALVQLGADERIEVTIETYFERWQDERPRRRQLLEDLLDIVV